MKLNNGKTQEYGYGWGIREVNGSPSYEHSGGIFGYTTNAIYLPKEDVFVALFSNCDCTNPGEISTIAAAKVIGKPFPEANPKLKLDTAYLKTLTGVYEFGDGATRHVTLDGDHLYSQRSGSSKFKLLPVDRTMFAFESGLSFMSFVIEGNAVKEVQLRQRSSVSKGKKSEKPLPTRVEIPVDASILGRYVGTYELQPGFDIVITLENGHLMLQATGQGKFELFAESETKFFLKVVDAQGEFVKGEGSKYDLIWIQGGRQTTGKRKS